jgi:hypothetical protein
VDDFNDNFISGWFIDQWAGGGGTVMESRGQLIMNIQPQGHGHTIYAVNTNRTYTIQDGLTVEFRVDLVSGNQNDAVAFINFNPRVGNPSAGYTLAKDTDAFFLVKNGGNGFWWLSNPIKHTQVTLVFSFTGEGNNVIIYGAVLDKENNNQVLAERTFVDTSAADPVVFGSDDPPGSYIGTAGYLTLALWHSRGSLTDPSQVIYDNAHACIYGPYLTIEQAIPESDITLSWPMTQANFVVETAPTVEGFWQPAPGDPELSGPNYRLTVPASELMQLFRLRLVENP